MPRDPHFRYALIGVLIVTLMRLLWLAGRPVDLYPDEAQYWIWAQHLAWGYYSKPPIIAWMIAATTGLLGDGELAIKSGALVLYFVTSLVVFALARRLYDSRVAAWATIAFVTLPSVSISSVVISTDVPLLLFWALATYGFVRAREPGGFRWWWLVGIAAGLGLLSKYAMGFWIGSAAGFLALDRRERRHLGPFAGALALAVLIYLPNLWWNLQHGFASYRHTADNADLQGGVALHPLALATFATAQLAVGGPIFVATLVLIVVRLRRTLAEPADTLLLVFALPTLLVMLTVALLSRAQPNWSAPTYVTATILVVAWLMRHGREAMVQWSVVLHVLLAGLVMTAGDLALATGTRLPANFDLLHRVRGWRTLGQSAAEIRLHQGMPPMLADEREAMSAFIYYMDPHPFDMRMWNPGGGVHNGFELDQSLPATPGGDYLWVTQRDRPNEVLNRFASHEQLAHILVPIARGSFREAWIYAVHGFKGYAGKAPETAAQP